MKSILVPSFALLAFQIVTTKADTTPFAQDIAFLKAHTDVVLLEDNSTSAKVAVIPAWQGRVMTSTARGDDGISFGWINRSLIASGKLQPHINAFGGEDRLWLGPEGGPFALFFPPGTREQTLKDWQTPAVLDTEPWKVKAMTRGTVTLTVEAVLKNRHGSELAIAFERTVKLLDRAEVEQLFGASLPGDVASVAYESDNRITNAGAGPWIPQTGMPSIWILGMFVPGPKTTVVVPLARTATSDSSPVRSDYFGSVPADRLRISGTTVFFKADGQYRSKIGVAPAWAKPLAGSWDPERGVLTLVGYEFPPDAASRPYVDSRWIYMAEPYKGDVLNSYNDGEPAPGVAPLGPFYELESSSPAGALAAGQTLRHRHRTVHLQGPRESLDRVARSALGVSLDQIEAAWAK